MGERTYLVGNSTIEVMFGDITTSAAEVLVSSDDFLLSMGGGVSMAIGAAAGRAFRDDVAKQYRVARAGDVVVTGAGNLGARYVLHAITIDRSIEVSPGLIVRSATRNAIEMLPRLHCRSIAFPAIGAGSALIPMETVVTEMVSALFECLLDEPASYRVELWLYRGAGRTQAMFEMIEQHFADRFAVRTSTEDGQAVQVEPGAALDSDNSGEQVQRDLEIYGILRQLDRRRAELESLVLATLTDKNVVAPDVSDLARQLRELEELRSIYEPQAQMLKPVENSATSVFVSSTSTDLQDHRRRVREVVEGLNLRFIGMEDFPPEATPPADYIRQRVVESENYVLILGMRYGYIDPASGISMTELEYHQAVSTGKPLRIFVMSDEAPITVNMVERDPHSMAKLIEFKQRVLASHTCRMFTDAEDLAGKVQHSLDAG